MLLQTIYDLKLNAQASVLFRGTGIVLTGGIAGLSILSIGAPGKATDYVKLLQQYPVLNAVAKFGIAFPLTYHGEFVNGSRYSDPYDDSQAHSSPSFIAALGGVRHMVRSQVESSISIVVPFVIIFSFNGSWLIVYRNVSELLGVGRRVVGRGSEIQYALQIIDPSLSLFRVLAVLGPRHESEHGLGL